MAYGINGSVSVKIEIRRIGGMHRNAVQVIDGGMPQFVKVEDISVEGLTDARMPDIGITAAHAIGNGVVDIGGLEGLRGHEEGSLTDDATLGRDADDVKLLVGIKT